MAVMDATWGENPSWPLSAVLCPHIIPHIGQEYEKTDPSRFLQYFLMDLSMDFSNPFLSLLMLSVSAASCGTSLSSLVTTTQRRISFHLCFYLMFHQFQWGVPSSAIEGFSAQQFHVYFTRDLHDVINFDHIPSQPPFLQKKTLLVW